MARTYWRPIRVEGRTYLWYVLGDRSVLVREDSKGSKKHRFVPDEVLADRAEKDDLSARYPREWWRYEDHESYGPSVRPGDVAKFVREGLLGLPPLPPKVTYPRRSAPQRERDVPWDWPGTDTGDYAVLMDVHRGEGTLPETRLVSLHGSGDEAKRRAAALEQEMRFYAGSKPNWRRHDSLWLPASSESDRHRREEAWKRFREEQLRNLETDRTLQALRFRAVLGVTAAGMGLACRRQA